MNYAEPQALLGKIFAHLLRQVRFEGPPMAWRGGAMGAAPRKTKLPLSPWNSRALLCANYKANLFSAAIRKAAVPYIKNIVQGNQSGAIKGGGTEFPMFIARLFLQLAAKQKKSAVLLFGDLRKAYYCVLLELVTGPLFTKAERQAFL